MLVVAWLAAMAAVGWMLAGSQSSSRAALRARVDARTKYAASFVSIYARDLLAREQAAAESWFSAPRVTQSELRRATSALGLNGAVLLDGSGQAIASLGLRSAVAIPAPSGVGFGEFDGAQVVSFAVGYDTPYGRRVFGGAYAMADTVIPAILGHVLSTPGWQAELIDGRGGRLVAGRRGRLPGSQASFSAPVAGTPWRIVIRDPETQLYGSVSGAGRWLAWLALGGLACAGLVVIFLFARLQRRRVQLTSLNDELARLAATDPLTGLRNRRAIEEYLHEALSAARRHELPLSLLVVDVDHFKNFNDRLGHRSGDAVLAHAARVLDGALRTEDAIGRWGGEEFLVVLPGTDEEGALHATERLRAALAVDQPDEARAHGLPVTVTIGLAEWNHEPVDEFVSRADDALYVGKGAGRDTVQVALSDPDECSVPALDPARGIR